MRILVLALDFKPNPGGVAEYTHRLALNAHRDGHRVSVLSQHLEDGGTFDAEIPYEVDRFDWRKRPRVLAVLGTLRRFVETLREHDPDVLVVNTLAYDGYLAWFAARLTSTPMVLFAYGAELDKHWEIHDVKDRLFATKEQIKRDLALRGADRVVCVSSHTRGMVHALGIAPDRTGVVYPGLDLEEIDGTDARLPDELGSRLRDRQVLLTVGRLVERKGVDRTLQALSALRDAHPDLVYVVAGDGPDRDRLEAMAKDLDVEASVIFTGYVEDEVKHGLLQVADVFVTANRRLDRGSVEGFGIVFLEAAAHGLPAVAGRSGGAPEAVAGGETGLVVDPEDPEAIAEAIDRLLSDPDLADRLGRAGRKRVAEEFTWEAAAAKLVSELEAVVEDPKGQD